MHCSPKFDKLSRNVTVQECSKFVMAKFACNSELPNGFYSSRVGIFVGSLVFIHSFSFICRPFRLTFYRWKSVPQGSVSTHSLSSFLQSNREFTTDFATVSTYLVAWVFSCFKFSRIGEFGLKSPKDYPSVSLSNMSNGTLWSNVHGFNVLTWEGIFFSSRESLKGRRLIHRSQSKSYVP